MNVPVHLCRIKRAIICACYFRSWSENLVSQTHSQGASSKVHKLRKPIIICNFLIVCPLHTTSIQNTLRLVLNRFRDVCCSVAKPSSPMPMKTNYAYLIILLSVHWLKTFAALKPHSLSVGTPTCTHRHEPTWKYWRVRNFMRLELCKLFFSLHFVLFSSSAFSVRTLWCRRRRRCWNLLRCALFKRYLLILYRSLPHTLDLARVALLFIVLLRCHYLI